MVETLEPEKIKEDIDSDTPKMSHVLSFTPGRFLCGFVPKTGADKLREFKPVDCVVCMDLWSRMSWLEQIALRAFWGAQSG